MQNRLLKILFAGGAVLAMQAAENQFCVVPQQASPYDSMSLGDLEVLSNQHLRDKARALKSCVKCAAVAGCSCCLVTTGIGLRLCCGAAGLPDAIAGLAQCLFISSGYRYFDTKGKIMEQKGGDIKKAKEKQIDSLYRKEHQD